MTTAQSTSRPAEPEDDWYDTTGETLALLRQFRRRRRRQRLRGAAFAGYLAALLGTVYGGTAAAHLVRSATTTHPRTALTEAVAAALPAGLTAALLLIALATLRDAAWRGPVLLPAPAADWLLPLPIRRRALLLPRLVAALVLAVAVGACAGLCGAVALHATGLPGFGRLALATSGGGALYGLFATAGAALLERYGRTARIRLASPLLAGAAGLMALRAVLAALGHTGPGWDALILWSGPWGWAAQPVVAAAGGAASRAAPWPYGLAVLVLVTLAVTGTAVLRVDGIPGAVLRERARTMSGVATLLMAGEARGARLLVRAVQGRRPLRWVRLPAPRARALVVPWRDATALLRAPDSLVWALLFTVAGVALGALGATLRPPVTQLLLALALLGGYLAAAQLAEPARLEADDPRRAHALPYTFSGLALRHAVVPTAVLAGFGALAGLPFALAGGDALPVLLAPATAPALTAASLASAYRGRLPWHLLFTGTDTGMGDPGPMLVVGWYLSAQLLLVALGTPLLTVIVLAWQRGAGTVPLMLQFLPWLLVVAAILLAWAKRRAQAVARA